MKGFGRSVALGAYAAALLVPGVLSAQNITVTPTGYITVALGGTKQFSAQVTGLMSSAVTWSVGRPGLNTGLGSIDSNGLYTAPSVLPGNTQIQITATSASNPTITGVTFVYLLANGPTLTSVSPNPLPAGQFTVTLTGTGFLPNAVVMAGGIQLSAKNITSTSMQASGYQAPATSTTFYVANPGSSPSNVLTVPVTAKTGDGSGGGGSGGGGGSTPAPVVNPGSVTLALGGAQQFNAANVTTWSAVSGTITSAGLYTAPAAMPASGKDTVTAQGPGGQGTATVTLVSNVPPAIQSISTMPLPLGVFSTVITGTGFTPASVAQLGGTNLAVIASTATTLSVTGFVGTGGTVNLTVANGPVVSQPFPVQVGVQNPLVSPAAARRFLEQAAFGPTPADAAHVQTIGFQAWLNEQFAMPVISNYNALLGTSQGGMPAWFLANAVTNPDQLRQRVAFALSQIFVTSITKLIWNQDMIPYQQMLLNDAFTSYRQILGDVTLSPGMGAYLDMANNENYAREVMQLFSIGTKMLNQDGTVQVDSTGTPIPTYNQTNVTELARVFTGWTYPAKTGGSVVWGAYINSANGPMVPFSAMHDFGSKTLLNGYVAAANLTPQQDLNGALDNLAGHSNVAPFISKQLIEHLVKSNPTPAYVQRVALAFSQSGGDMKTVLTAILLDQEARANDNGGGDQPTDGHLQEPVLMLPGFVRAFGGTMTPANYYTSVMAAMGEDIYNPASVFNYYSPGYVVAGSGGLLGPEFQIDNPNAAILRENLVGSFFNQYSNPVQSYGPGTTVDLTPFLPLAATPATLVDALDLTLTHGTMPAGMKQIVVNAVQLDNGGNLHRVQTGIYLILSSSYYNVWH
jgi:hypothetical protein